MVKRKNKIAYSKVSKLFKNIDKALTVLDSKTKVDVFSDQCPSLKITQRLDEIDEIRDYVFEIYKAICIMKNELEKHYG